MSGARQFDRGLDLERMAGSLGFRYGRDVFGPLPEMRELDAIRASLREPGCAGPDPVYGIAMDVGRREDRAELERRYLLFGVVAYAAGRLGEEPVRSQGHVHGVAPHCGWSTPELFEIWEGRAIIYAQQFAGDEPGRCCAVEAAEGDKVVVPPGWTHAVINADSQRPMLFAALCDRQYSFDYRQVRAHQGLAWFPLVREGGIAWEANARYRASTLQVRSARGYPELGLSDSVPIYRQFVQDADAVQWVSEPALKQELWKDFEP